MSKMNNKMKHCAQSVDMHVFTMDSAIKTHQNTHPDPWAATHFHCIFMCTHVRT